MWCELIHSLEPAAQFATEANEIQFTELKATLSVTLSDDLRALLREANGVCDPYGFCIIWSIDEIARYNREMRTFPHYRKDRQPFTDFLFFADAGNGDRFAFPILQGKVQQGPVFAWDHEDNARREVASSLKSFLEGWLRGEISV